MLKQIIVLACALSTACSAGFRGVTAHTTEGVSCEGGVAKGQIELERYNGCTAIGGDLLVEDVESLAPLAHVERIDGNLRIEHTRHLYSLSGLERLRSLHELTLRDNRGLINGGALHGLAHAQSVFLTENPRLSRGYGFGDGLVQSGARLDLRNNTGLTAEGMKEFHELASGTTVAQR
jgi:hypothetical protein